MTLLSHNIRDINGFAPPFLPENISDRERAGFTLAEILLAVAILAFVLASLLALFISCMLLNDASRNLTQATGHAQFVMEEIRNTDFSDVLSKVNDGDWDWDSSAINTQGLTALRSESIDAEAAGTDPLEVTVAVGWQDRSGRNRQMELETLFTQQ